MIRRGMLSLVLLFACGTAAHAAGDFLAGGWESCEQMNKECADASAEDIYDVSLFFGTGSTILGTCYVHDKTSCPDCACWDYVKVTYKPQPKGWDGGTGCMGSTGTTTQAQSRQRAADKLKELCESGACCCPTVPAQPCSNPNPVKARDPLTGSCCTFPNGCSAPSDWQPNDSRCG
jgi:hypothetical protein